MGPKIISRAKYVTPGSVDYAECGVRSAECGVRSMENAECGKCGVKLFM